MDAGIGEQLVDIVEPPDVADLRDERGTGRGTDPGDGLQAPGQLPIEQGCDALIGLGDLALEQVVLVEQQADLEGDLVVELGYRDRPVGGSLESFRLRLAQAPVPWALVGVGEGARPALPGGCGGGGDPQDLPSRCGRQGRRRAHPARGSPAR